MPGCTMEREVIGSTALYRISGKFEGACAWELASRIEKEPLSELTLDFWQCNEFVDYGIAVLANLDPPAASREWMFVELRLER